MIRALGGCQSHRNILRREFLNPRFNINDLFITIPCHILRREKIAHWERSWMEHLRGRHRCRDCYAARGLPGKAASAFRLLADLELFRRLNRRSDIAWHYLSPDENGSPSRSFALSPSAH